MDQFDEDLKHAKSALMKLFSLELSNTFENVVDEGEFDGDAIIEDLNDVDDSNIIDGINITDPTKQTLFCRLIIYIFKDHNYDIDSFITAQNTSKHIKDMDLNQFIELICAQVEAINVNSFNKDVLISTLYNESYDGHKFYSTMNESKHLLKFAKLLKKADISMGKGKEIGKRIKNKIDPLDDFDIKSKKLNEMSINEFVYTIIDQLNTNDGIKSKLGDRFNENICKDTLITNDMNCAKFIELGKKKFAKICKTATVIAGPANKLYRAIKTRYDTEENEKEEKEKEEKEKKGKEKEIEEEIDIKDKKCVTMTQNQFIQVIIDHFNEYNLKKNMNTDLDILVGILRDTNIDYDSFMAMKSSGFSKLMKDKMEMKKGQSVAIYKHVTKRIENERQQSFVPLIEQQLSNYGDLRNQLSRHDTMTILNLLQKDKEIDQHFVRDASKIHIFENKLKSKVPSIKTGVAIQIFHGLHDLVNDDDEQNKEKQHVTMDEFADIVIKMVHQDDIMDKLNQPFDFDKLRNVILEEKMDGKQFTQYTKKEFSNIFKKANVPVGISRRIMKKVKTDLDINGEELHNGDTRNTLDTSNTQDPVDTIKTEDVDTINTEDAVDTITTEDAINIEDAINTEDAVDTMKTEDVMDTMNTEDAVYTIKTEDAVDTMNTEDVSQVKAPSMDTIQESRSNEMELNKIVIFDGSSGYISKLNEFQISKIMKNLADESLSKLFDQIKNGIHKNNVNGIFLLQHLIHKTEDEFKLFFAKHIHSKCSTFSSDLYLMIANNDGKIAKIKDKNIYELTSYIIYLFTQKIGELIVDEEIDGIKYLELGKTGVTKKLAEYLSFGLARRLVGNVDHYLNEAYNVQTNVMYNDSNHSNDSNYQIQINKLTPRQSFSSSIGALVTVGDDEEEEEESKYSQTLGLSEVVPFLNNSNFSLINNNNNNNENKEEQELSQFAIECYKKSNKKALKQCRQNVYKHDINKLLPHINIDKESKPINVLKKTTIHTQTTTISISFKQLTVTATDATEDDDDDNDDEKKGQNLSGQKLIFSSFCAAAKSIYKINDKENVFYATLYEDVIKERNGFVNTLNKYEIQEWIANYECNRIKYVIFKNKINCKQFRILSKHKLRDNKKYLGFLPKKRRRKLYDDLVKYISNTR